MPKYTITYFNLRGRAEVARLILKQAGVDFEDKRIEREQWPELKKTIPFGQLPLLEVEGQKICQSVAIARYLAKEVGLAGANNLECAKIDFIADCLVDFMNKFIPIFREQDATKKAELQKKFSEETFGPFMTHLTAMMEANGGEYLAGKLSWVDLFFFDMLTRMKDEVKTASPKLAALLDRVGALPNIKKWVETRPETSM